MLPAAVMGHFPSGVNNRGRAGLDNAIASAEPYGDPGLNQFNMRPLVLMVMYVIGDLAE